MKLIYNEALEIYSKKNEGDVTKKLIKSDIETGSKYVNDELRYTISYFVNMINKDNVAIDNDSLNFDFDKGVAEYHGNRNLDLDVIIESFNGIEIDETDTTTKKYLLNIHNRLKKIEESFDRENIDEDYKNNSEMVYKLMDSLITKFENVYKDSDANIKRIVKHYRNSNKNINKSNIKSKNYLNIDHVINNVNNMKDFILNDPENIYVKEYFDNLKYKIFNDVNDDESENLPDSILNEINDLKLKINDKIENFNQYSSPEGHIEEGIHIIDLINNYNEVCYTAIDTYNDGFKAEIISINDELKNRVNYIRLRLFYDSMNKIMNNNPQLFKLNNGANLEEYVNPNGINYYFGSNKITEPTTEELGSIINQAINSKSDAVFIFTDEDTNKYQLIELKRSLRYQYKLVVYEPAFIRDPNEITELNAIINRNNFLSNIKGTDMNNESFEETIIKNAEKYRSLYNKVSHESRNPITNIEEANELYNDINNNADNSEINSKEDYIKCVEGVKKETIYLKNNIICSSGKIEQDVHDKLTNYYSEFTGKTSKIGKVVTFKPIDSKFNPNKDKKVTSQMTNYNNKIIKTNPKSTIHPKSQNSIIGKKKHS